MAKMPDIKINITTVVVHDPPKDHVIIKGWHDSGSIEAVYGPYTQQQATWIHAEFLADSSGNNWTVMKLATSEVAQ